MSNDNPGNLNDVLADLDLPAEAQERIKAAARGRKSRRLGSEAIEAKYTHVVPGTLSYDAEAGKQVVMISCQHEGCDATRRTFTSDLFQVSRCDEHKKEARREARKARREASKASAPAAS